MRDLGLPRGTIDFFGNYFMERFKILKVKNLKFDNINQKVSKVVKYTIPFNEKVKYNPNSAAPLIDFY